MGKSRVPKRLLSAEFKDWKKQVDRVKKIIAIARTMPPEPRSRSFFLDAMGRLEELERAKPKRMIEELAQQPREES